MNGLTKYNMLNYPLSSDEMIRLNPDAKLIVYTTLNDCFDIRDMFKDKDKLIILYLLQSKTSGHWVCLFRRDDGLADFEFFDSYGVPEDEQLDRLTYGQRAEFNERKNRLTTLLNKYRVIYNNVRLQANNTDTCGMFVTHRLHYSSLCLKDYVDMLLHMADVDSKSPDYVVAEYCLAETYKT